VIWRVMERGSPGLTDRKRGTVLFIAVPSVPCVVVRKVSDGSFRLSIAPAVSRGRPAGMGYFGSESCVVSQSSAVVSNVALTFRISVP
jgi:hypothetical protein